MPCIVLFSFRVLREMHNFEDVKNSKIDLKFIMIAQIKGECGSLVTMQKKTKNYRLFWKNLARPSEGSTKMWPLIKFSWFFQKGSASWTCSNVNVIHWMKCRRKWPCLIDTFEEEKNLKKKNGKKSLFFFRPFYVKKFLFLKTVH